jgi:hypothetical protein
MEVKQVLKGLIENYQNDFLCGYEGDDKGELRIIFLELIVEVTRLANDYRYCSKKECPCSPEKSIETLVETHSDKIFNKLLGGYMGLCEPPLSVQRNFFKGFLVEETDV